MDRLSDVKLRINEGEAGLTMLMEVTEEIGKVLAALSEVLEV